MLFNSLTFILFFFVVVSTRLLPTPWRLQKATLLVFSYAFYAAWNPPFVVLLWISTIIDWVVARRMVACVDARSRKLWLLVSLSTNLGMLGFFKYGAFLQSNFIAAAQLAGFSFEPAPFSVILPVGISFYTFQTLSYTFDVYRGRLAPWDDPLDFALFVSFFPQLVAGPIVRAKDFLPQCRERRRIDGNRIGWGLTLMVIGLFEKVLLADAWLAPAADMVFANPGSAGLIDAWAGAMAFAGQIYFDFAGYSLCAIGAALCLGFSLPDNFRAPYGALGFSDFWRRWHISLSTWLRDYLYIALGGNRRGTVRTYANIMATMLLGGLWHGAAWRFVLWGGLHGLYLTAERQIPASWRQSNWSRWRSVRAILMVLTFALVCVTWVFFRASDFDTAMTLIHSMMGASGLAFHNLPLLRLDVVGVIVAGLLICHGLFRDTSLESLWERLPWTIRGLALGAMLTALIFSPGDVRAFIYFQF